MKPIYTPNMFKRDMYLALRGQGDEYDDNGLPIVPYEKPMGFIGNNGVNYQPLTSESDIQRYGASSVDVVKAVIMNTDLAYKHFNSDMVGSLVYFFDASPFKKPRWDNHSETENEPEPGYWANYKVDAVLPMMFHTNVFFKKDKRTGAN